MKSTLLKEKASIVDKKATLSTDILETATNEELSVLMRYKKHCYGVLVQKYSFN